MGSEKMRNPYFYKTVPVIIRYISTTLFCIAPVLFNCSNMLVAHETTKPVASFPKIDRVPDPSTIGGQTLASLPHYDSSSGAMWQLDLRGANLSQLDLRDRISDLVYADFDSRTVWADSSRMPPGFDYNRIMELYTVPARDLY